MAYETELSGQLILYDSRKPHIQVKVKGIKELLTFDCHNIPQELIPPLVGKRVTLLLIMEDLVSIS